MSRFERSYFEGEGYADMYRDFPVHYLTARKVLERKPTSVLEVGGARGFIAKILENHNVPATVVEVSEYCRQNRVVESFVKHDITITPWLVLGDKKQIAPNKTHVRYIPIEEKKYDLCFSIAVLEHIPEDKVNVAISEMIRVSKRGMHGITFKAVPNDIDKTHVCMHPKEWWEAKFKEIDSSYPVEILDKESLETGDITEAVHNMAPSDDMVKLNIGSFLDMFHYGWVNIDRLDLSNFAAACNYDFKIMDVLNGINYPSNSVDIILASHVFEHFNRNRGKQFLSECFRVLKDQGILRLVIPDSKLLARMYLDASLNKLTDFAVEIAQDSADAFFKIMLDGHVTIYDVDSVKSILREVGDCVIEVVSPFSSKSMVISKQTFPLHHTVSAFIEVTVNKSTASSSIAPRVTSTVYDISGNPITSTSTSAVELPNGEAISKSSKKKCNLDKLNIALLSTPMLKVPPDNYGGLELIVYDLGECLAKLRHNVTIFAPDKSSVSGCKVIEVGPEIKKVHVDWLKAEADMFDKIEKYLPDFDVIHGHK